MGTLEVIVGPMFSGKTEELIRRLVRAEIGRQKVLCVKPSFDVRSARDQVTSHTGRSLPSTTVAKVDEMLSAVLELDSEVVGVEETQFFGETILPVIEQMLEENRRVICAGLDLDAFERPFPPMPHLMALADRVDKLSAVCVKCGSEATRSQLLHLAEPAGEAWIELGGSEAYEARCRDCFEHPTGHIEAGSHQHVFIEEA